MLDPAQFDQVLGQPLYDAHGSQVGLIGQVYVYPDSAAPQWVTVHTGAPSTMELFVPVAGATAVGMGLGVPYGMDTVLTAPRADGDTVALSPMHVARLYRHYGVVTSADHPHSGPTHDQDQQDNAAMTSGGGGMTRSEEQLTIATETYPTETVRLRKHIITEEKTITVSVRREVFTLERAPVAEHDSESVGGGLKAEPSHLQYETVLHEEQIVVNKKMVPIERVTLFVDVVAEQREITEQVRKEQIETETTDSNDTPPDTTAR
ncbi:MAG: YsnF/AvaK domain-containing protein [Actinomycetota bacterium]|nr:YsnF/AvaK domain-containing protein [Actinomycetota bacterium]